MCQSGAGIASTRYSSFLCSPDPSHRGTGSLLYRPEAAALDGGWVRDDVGFEDRCSDDDFATVGPAGAASPTKAAPTLKGHRHPERSEGAEARVERVPGTDRTRYIVR